LVDHRERILLAAGKAGARRHRVDVLGRYPRGSISTLGSLAVDPDGSSVRNKSEVNDMPVEEVCMSIAFPNESREYREARDALLQREVDLQREMEAVEAQRGSLPTGGEVPEDYVFDRMGDDGAATTVRMSELSGDSDTLMLY